MASEPWTTECTPSRLREAQMEEKQADIASQIPDWSPFATQQDLAELKSELMRRQGIRMGAIAAALTALRFIPCA